MKDRNDASNIDDHDNGTDVNTINIQDIEFLYQKGKETSVEKHLVKGYSMKDLKLFKEVSNSYDPKL